MQFTKAPAGVAPGSYPRHSVKPYVSKAAPAMKRAVIQVRRWAPDSKAAVATPSPLLSKLEQESAKGQVYGKPLTKSETAALKAAVEHFNQNSNIDSPQALRSACLSLLQEAASTKKPPLNIVEGSMVLLEQLYLKDARTGKLVGTFTPQDMLCRWQLVIGADVGSIQYIPVVEELQAAPGGATFNLDTDLNTIFTGFSGDSSWLSPGHLQYHVQRVRIELRLPKEVQFWNRGKVEEVKPDDGKGTCRPDFTKPAVTLPLPFPVNELFIFDSNGELGVLRSKLGGLILLVNKTPATERNQIA